MYIQNYKSYIGKNPHVSKCCFLVWKCTRTHLRASVIFKSLQGVIPPNPRYKEAEGGGIRVGICGEGRDKGGERKERSLGWGKGRKGK